MRMKRRSGVSAFVPLAFVVFVLVGAPAWAGQAILLTDAELDQVYGGEIEQEIANGNNNVQTANMCGTCTLNVTDSAQAGASAMIMVNAVGAVVNAQMNMTVYNGSYGTVNQMDVGFTTTGGGNITN